MHLNKVYSFVGEKEFDDIAERRDSSESRGQLRD
jgi:hypothetical protein